MEVFINSLLLKTVAVFVTFSQFMSAEEYCDNLCHITSNSNCSSLALPGCFFTPLNSETLKNNTDCIAQEFHQDSAQSNVLRVKLAVYISVKCAGVKMTSFNLTFSNINWTYLRYRFKRMDHSTKSFCEEVRLLSDAQISSTAELHRDCRWDSSEYEGDDYYFQYEAGCGSSPREGRKYVLTVPKSGSIDYYSNKTLFKDLKVFLYVDISALPQPKLVWQQVPKHLQVKKYLAKCFLDGILIHPEKEVPANPDKDELVLDFYDVSLGTFYCTVQIYDSRCNEMGEDGCALSKSPKIIIGGVLTHYYIAIICVFSILLLMFFGCCQIAKSRFTLGTPVVLIIYKQTMESHSRAVLALAQHLRATCQIEALVDQLDIPHFSGQNPFTWCQGAFARANCVMVLSSPCQDSNTAEGIYRNVDAVGLRLLEDFFIDGHFERKFFSVLLPYCNKTNIPSEAVALKCFKLMEDWDRMLRHIHFGSASSFLRKMKFFCFKSQIPGCKSKLKKHSIQLLTAFNAVWEEIQASCDTSQCAFTNPTLGPSMTKLSHEPMTPLLKSIPVEEGSNWSTQQDEQLHAVTACNSSVSKSPLPFPGDIKQLNLSGREEGKEMVCDADTCTDASSSHDVENDNRRKEDGVCYFDLHSVLR